MASNQKTVTSTKTATIHKTAVDAVASAYWTKYFQDTGYGRLWVRKIPRKIKAALAENTKTASKLPTGEPEFRPIGAVVHDDGVSLEGVASWPDKTARAFVVDFDHDGNVLDFTSLPISN